MVLLVPSRCPCHQHAFSTPCFFLRPSEKGFNPEGLHLPPAARCFSPRGTGCGGGTSSRFGRAGVFPAPRRGRAGLPLISRLLPAGHPADDLSALAGQEGGGAHGSPPPPPPLPKGRAVRHGGGGSSVRSPWVPGRGPQHPAGATGRGWAGGELSTRGCWVAQPPLAPGGQEGAGTLPPSSSSLENWGAVWVVHECGAAFFLAPKKTSFSPPDLQCKAIGRVEMSPWSWGR